MLRKTLAIVLAVGFLGAFAGCNTMKGLGQDIERGGDKLQNKAEQVQRSN